MRLSRGNPCTMAPASNCFSASAAVINSLNEFTQVFANAAKQYLTGAAAEGRAGGSSSTTVRGALQQRRAFYPGNVSLRGDSSQQVPACLADVLFVCVAQSALENRLMGLRYANSHPLQQLYGHVR